MSNIPSDSSEAPGSEDGLSPEERLTRQVEGLMEQKLQRTYQLPEGRVMGFDVTHAIRKFGIYRVTVTVSTLTQSVEDRIRAIVGEPCIIPVDGRDTEVEIRFVENTEQKNSALPKIREYVQKLLGKNVADVRLHGKMVELVVMPGRQEYACFTLTNQYSSSDWIRARRDDHLLLGIYVRPGTPEYELFTECLVERDGRMLVCFDITEED